MPPVPRSGHFPLPAEEGKHHDHQTEEGGCGGYEEADENHHPYSSPANLCREASMKVTPIDKTYASEADRRKAASQITTVALTVAQGDPENLRTVLEYYIFQLLSQMAIAEELREEARTYFERAVSVEQKLNQLKKDKGK